VFVTAVFRCGYSEVTNCRMAVLIVCAFPWFQIVILPLVGFAAIRCCFTACLVPYLALMKFQFMRSSAYRTRENKATTANNSIDHVRSW